MGEPRLICLSDFSNTLAARALTVLVHPSFPRPLLHDLAGEAARQYRKTIKVLRQYVEQAVLAPVAIEPILLACLLCVVFEAFRGKKSAAVDHARLGWRIARDRASYTEMQSSPSVMFFRSFSLQHAGAFALFDDKEHHDSDCCLGYQFSQPDVFDSLSDATNRLNMLVKLAEHFRSDLLHLAKAYLARITRLHDQTDLASFCLSTCLSRTIAISESQRSHWEDLRAAHKQWKLAYSLYAAIVPTDDLESSLILRIKYLYSNFILATCRDSGELHSDQFMHDFKDALDATEQYLSVARNNFSSSHQPNSKGVFGFSVLPTLHVIAHKCRDPQLRRRAIHILSTAQKREGLEHSSTLALYAKAAVDIEEFRALSMAAQSTDVDGQTVPMILPEQARIADCVTMAQLAPRELGVVKMTCARYLHGDSGPKQIELTQYEAGAVPLRLCSTWVFDLSDTM